jgi:hypothetical protein
MPKHSYRRNRLKIKHSIIKPAMPYVNGLLELDFITLIVPDVIDNHSHGKNRMKISSPVANGFNLTFGGAGAQKFHILCEPTEAHRAAIEAVIRRISGERG